MQSDNAKRDLEKEGKGYWSLMLIVLLFPIAFFLCAFFSYLDGMDQKLLGLRFSIDWNFKAPAALFVSIWPAFAIAGFYLNVLKLLFFSYFNFPF